MFYINFSPVIYTLVGLAAGYLGGRLHAWMRRPR